MHLDRDSTLVSTLWRNKYNVVLFSRRACLLCVISSTLIMLPLFKTLEKVRTTTHEIIPGYLKENKTKAQHETGKYIHCEKSISNHFSWILKTLNRHNPAFSCYWLKLTFERGSSFLRIPFRSNSWPELAKTNSPSPVQIWTRYVRQKQHTSTVLWRCKWRPVHNVWWTMSLLEPEKDMQILRLIFSRATRMLVPNLFKGEVNTKILFW